MKKLLLVSLLFCLSGCSLVGKIASLNVASFNGSEYDKITHLRYTIAVDEGRCDDQAFMKTAAEDINNQAFELALYSQGIYGNQDTAALTANLHQLTSELNKRYASVNSVSSFYCDDKMQILLRAATTIQKAIGGKP